MTITGAIKFFKRNWFDSLTTMTATSAAVTAADIEKLFDNDRSTLLISDGSDDVTPEVWIITLNEEQAVDRIHILNHNIKAGELKYWNGSSYASFSTAVSWSGNTETDQYFEFNEVTTIKFQLTMNTTLVVDAQKQVGQLRILNEVGTMTANPRSANPKWDESSINKKTANNGSVFVSLGEKYSVDLDFQDSDDTDRALIRSLKALGEPFFIYPGGGSANDEESFRIRDMYLVNFINPFSFKLRGNLFDTGVMVRLKLREA